MSRFDVVVVGAGYIAQAEHLPGWRTRPDARVAGVVDSRPHVAAKVGAALDVPWFVDLDTALSSVECEAVHVCTPPGSHPSLVASAMRQGKHVLVEKPLALDVTAAVGMVDAAAAAGMTLMIAAPRLYDADFRFVGEAILRGDLGVVRAVESVWRLSRPPVYEVIADAPRTSAEGYSLKGVVPIAAKLLEESIHHLGLLRTWFPGDVTVEAVLVSGPVLHVTMTLAEGVVALHTNAAPLAHGETVQVYGDDATIRAEPWSPHFPWTFGRTTVTARRDGDRRSPAIARVNPYWAQLDDFVRTARRQQAPRRDPVEAVRDIELIEQIVRAWTLLAPDATGIAR
jgi:predicted dehydrogenase